MEVTRRTFLTRIIGVIGAILGRRTLLLYAEGMPAGTGTPTGGREHLDSTIGRHFAGEALDYAMSFLWFRNAASCRVTFQETAEPGIYEATIVGQTHGIIGAFTRFRRDILSARMEEVDAGKRFRPLEFCEDVIVGSKHRKKTTRFDYQNHRITILRERKGTIREKILPLPPEETYYDPLTASYNFRFGSFGPVERGRKYVIKTVPEKKTTEIHVAVAAPGEEQGKKRPEGVQHKHAYFVYLQLDKELIRSTSGKIEGWLSEAMVPLEGRVRDVVLFGDVVGRIYSVYNQPIESNPT